MSTIQGHSVGSYNVTEPGLDHLVEEPSGTWGSWKAGGLFHSSLSRGLSPQAQAEGNLWSVTSALHISSNLAHVASGAGRRIRKGVFGDWNAPLSPVGHLLA